MTAPARLPLDPARDLRIPVPLAKWPFFALAAQQAEVTYEGRQGGRRAHVHLRPEHADSGLATLADAEIIVWAASAYTKLVNQGQPLPATLAFHPGELLRFFGRPGGGRQHALLAAGLQRLANTSVDTDIGPGATLHLFRWLEAVSIPPSRRAPWSIQPPAWLRAVVEHREILKAPPEFFVLRGLRRRLYLWACAHAGGRGHERYRLSMSDAYARSGSKDKQRRFIYELRSIVRDNDLPSFTLMLETEGAYDYLVLERSPDAARPAVDGTAASGFVSPQWRGGDGPREIVFTMDDPDDIPAAPRPPSSSSPDCALDTLDASGWEIVPFPEA